MVEVQHLTHRYGQRVALADVSLNVDAGESFCLLGPNGSGKTTLFRILSTLLAPQEGAVRVAGFELPRQTEEIRRCIGVVFQSPSLDKQLTAQENLRHHGHLYGLRGRELSQRIEELLTRLGLADRAGERVSAFSGGMRRRVELAKGLISRPRILLLDEPSTGIDPAARLEMWRYLEQIRQSDGVTILLTTHLMEEADGCRRVAILDQGKLIACDRPAALKERIGGDVITLTSQNPSALRDALRERFAIQTDSDGTTIRFERGRGHEFLPQLIAATPGMVDAVTVAKPTLEDVFLQLTGHRLNEESDSVPQA